VDKKALCRRCTARTSCDANGPKTVQHDTKKQCTAVHCQDTAPVQKENQGCVVQEKEHGRCTPRTPRGAKRSNAAQKKSSYKSIKMRSSFVDLGATSTGV
jgi:hypothetical protein